MPQSLPPGEVVNDEMSGLAMFNIFVGFMASVYTLASVLGFILAFTVNPSAINMGIGAGIGAPLFWGMFAAFRYLDS
jgi:hypothetical protein